MARKALTQKRKNPSVTEPPRPAMKLFRPASWYDGEDDPVRYLIHLHRELGRLNITEHQLRDWHEQILRNTQSWLAEHPGEAYAKLVDWTNLDTEVLVERYRADLKGKPEIELTVEITKKDNLSVRWYPRGWHEAAPDLKKEWRSSLNLIERYRFPRRPDFLWFEGDEPASFHGRASNELMFIRGVGHLAPQPPEQYGYFATYNWDVVDAIMICMVAAAYNSLISHLSHSFSVTVVDRFQIETVDEPDPASVRTFDFPIRRPVSWKLIASDPPSLRPSAEVVAFRSRPLPSRDKGDSEGAS